MEGARFSIKEALNSGYEAFKARWAFLIGITLFYFVFPLVPQLLQSLLSDNALISRAILGIFHFVFMVVASIGFFTIVLKAARGEGYDFSDFFSNIHLFPSYLFGQILFGLAILFGLFLLVIPGIYWGVAFSLFPFFVLDRSFSGIDSLKASKAAVYGAKWRLFFFLLLSIFINILGLIFFGAGLLVTTPITSIALASIYLKLTKPAL